MSSLEMWSPILFMFLLLLLALTVYWLLTSRHVHLRLARPSVDLPLELYRSYPSVMIKKNRTLYERNQKLESTKAVFVLESGLVQLETVVTGAGYKLYKLSLEVSQGLVGLDEVLADQTKRSWTAYALTNLRVRILPRRVVETYLKQHPQQTQEIIRALSLPQHQFC